MEVMVNTNKRKRKQDDSSEVERDNIRQSDSNPHHNDSQL